MNNPTHKASAASVLLQAVGGGLLTASLGGLLGFAIASNLSQTAGNSNPSGDFGDGLAAGLIVLASTGIGGLIGLVWFAKLSINGNRSRLLVPLAALGYVAAFLILIKILYGL